MSIHFSTDEFTPSTLVDLLRYRAENNSSQIAYRFLSFRGAQEKTYEVNLTYRQLDLLARNIGAQLQQLGAEGKRVLLIFPQGPEYVSAFFGCLYAGAVAVPVFPPKHRNVSRLQSIATDSQAALVLTTHSTLGKIKFVVERTLELQGLQWLATDCLEEGLWDNWQEPSCKSETLALLQYTSGSTSMPKGVMLNHENLLDNSAHIYRTFEHSPHDIVVSWLPIYHDMGLIGGILQPLYGGFPCVVMSPSSFVQNPYRWLQAISKYKATTSGGPNFGYDLCVRNITSQQKETLDLRHWSLAFNGAEPINFETLDRFTKAFEPCGFRQKSFFPCYGLAEATLIVSGNKRKDSPIRFPVQKSALEQNAVVKLDGANNKTKDIQYLVSCGQPMLDSRVLIVDPRSLTRCSEDQVGEIWVFSRSVAKGYWDNKDETQEYFHARLADTGEGPFLRTGDLGFVNNGDLFVTGRLKDLIIIRGRNHYPQDIERTVMHSHPTLRKEGGAAFSVAVSGDERLIVIQELDQRHQPERSDLEALVEAIRQAVIQEHEVQLHAIVLIKPGSIPKTTSGKIRRQTCKKFYLTGKLKILSEWYFHEKDTTTVENRTSNLFVDLQKAQPHECRALLLEQIVMTMSRVMGLPKKTIEGYTGSLYDLGLDSLMAVELKTSLEQGLGLELPVTLVLESHKIEMIVDYLLTKVMAFKKHDIPSQDSDAVVDSASSMAGRLDQFQSVLASVTPPLILAREQGVVPPLSFAQERLWFLDQLVPDNPFYNLSGAVRLIGSLNVAVLEQSLAEIVQRHEVLRARFVTIQGQPVQWIDVVEPEKLALDDLMVLTRSAEREAVVQQRIRAEVGRPFDLTKEPLLRVRLLRLQKLEHVLLVTFHHIIADGWSVRVFLRELTVLYTAYVEKQPLSLPELEIQYGDYAVWQRERLTGERLEGQLSYWKSQLAGCPPMLHLPTDYERPAVQTFKGATQLFSLSPVLVERLRVMSRREGVTLFMTLLAGWQLLLMRYTGQTDIVVGTPIANRTRAEVEPLIGFFVNTLVLRTNLSGDPTVRELLKRVREVALGAYGHQDVPFERVVDELQPERNLSHSPLCQVTFGLQNAPIEELSLPGMSIEALPIESGIAKFDLTLSMTEAAASLEGAMEYNTALFNAPTIARMVDQWQVLLEALVSEPEQRIGTLPVLPASERRQLLVDWNATSTVYPEEHCVHELVEVQAARTPEAVAVVYEDQQLTYAELNAQANQLAHYLRRLGVGPDVLVGICLERSLEMVVGVLGVLKAGGAYVPLDPSYPTARLEFMLTDSQPAVILTQAHVSEKLPSPNIVTCCLDTQRATLAAYPCDNLVGNTRPTHLAYMIYTSGSTGQPKGVMVTHRGLCNLVTAQVGVFAPKAGDCILQFASFSFDASVSEIFMALSSGAGLSLFPRAAYFSNDDLIQKLQEHPINIVTLPPSTLTILSSEQDFPDLATIIVAGEACPKELGVAWSEGRRFFNAYGPSEGSVCASIHEYNRATAASPGQYLPIGRPIANTQVYVLDDESEPVPVGVVGELYIGGVGLARGYWHRPELTAEKFVPHPFSQEPGARLYRTGDLAKYQADGTLEYLGRRDHQVKLRGFRIELGEIEARVAQHPKVQQVVVSKRGEQLVGYVVAVEAEAMLSDTELRSFVATSLPTYMVPAEFVWLTVLPLTPNGKVDRKALPMPSGDRPELAVAYVAPCSPMEETIAGIWEEVLELEQVGRHDNFFELGGHSLLAVTLIERMRQVGLPAKVRTLFTAPTVAALAAAIDPEGEEVDVPPNLIPEMGTDTITPAMLPLVELSADEISYLVSAIPGGARNVQDIYPLAPLQEGILFHHLMSQTGDAYLLSSVLSFDTRERLDCFLRSLQTIIDRHDILRTAVWWEGVREPVQVVWRQAPLEVEEPRLEAQAKDITHQLRAYYDSRHYRLDVRQAPLVRAGIVQDEGKGRWLLQLMSHHLISDYTTLEILLGEIQAIQQDECEQLPPPLPFRTFVAQTRLSVSQAAHEAFFTEMLAGVEEPTLPFGLQDVHGVGEGIEEARRAVDSELAERMRHGARKLGVSAASLLHLAWAQVLARLSGQQDVVFGTVLLGRMHGGAGADRMPGLFINTLPIRISVGAHGVAQSVRETHMRLTRLLRHEHASLALAQRCSDVVAPTPLFTTLLNYRHNQREDDAATSVLGEGIELLGIEERTNYPLTLSVDDEGDGFVLTVQVCALDQAERIGNYMHTVLEHLVEALEMAPETPVSQLEVLPASERRQLLVDWNATSTVYPEEHCVHELVEVQAARTPEAVAVVYEDQQLTYAELNAQANQLAHYLRRLGVGPDVLVGICLERSLEMVVGVLGVLKAGGAYVPLDPSYPTARLEFMLTDSQPAVILTQAHVSEKLPSPNIVTCCLDTQRATLAAYPCDNLVGNTRPTHLAYMIYTSGSTGQPKGVMVTHQGVVNYLSWGARYYPMDQGKGALVHSSITFDMTVTSVFLPLLVGLKVILGPEGINLEAIGTALCGDHDFSLIKVTPSHLRGLQEILSSKRTLNLPPAIVIGGEALYEQDLFFWLRHSSGVRLINEYGPTESVVGCCVHQALLEHNTASGDVPIGQPIANTQVYVLDDESEPVPVGVVGELYIGGVGLARGYWHRPELTAEKFVPHPFSQEPGARLYRTGDLAKYQADGTLEYLGRRDHQVKLRGFRIELGEIEATLLQHSAVQQAVVVKRGKASGGAERLVAYIVRQDEIKAVDGMALREVLLQSLPDYMVPAEFVWLTALPLTPSGKVDRNALPNSEGAGVFTANYEGPVGDVEQTLASMLEDLLGLESVGRDDNFFELGGHSLLAIFFLGKIQREFNQELSISSLFQGPTIRQIATTLSKQSPLATSSSLVSMQTKGSNVPFFCIHPIMGTVQCYAELAESLGEEQPFYGLQARGLEAEQAPIDTIEAMATLYIREILTVQKGGPFLLGGWSMGGVIAFEIAQQLLSRGHEVSLLVLIDAYAPSNEPEVSEEVVLAKHLMEFPGVAPALSQEQLLNMKWEEQLEYIVRQTQVANLAPADTLLSDIRHLGEVYKANLLAIHRYKPRVYPDTVTLFQACEPYSDDFSYVEKGGWDDLAVGGVESHVLPGNHDTIVKLPHVRVLAERLRDCIENAID